jgi:hypothetical protein
MQALLEAGAGIGQGEALAAAAGGGHLAAVHLLLGRCRSRTATWRANVATIALKDAAGGGHLAVMQALWDAGADARAPGPLQAAAAAGRVAAAAALLYMGAAAAPAAVRSTALLAAAESGSVAVMRLLLAAGAAAPRAALFAAAVKSGSREAMALVDGGEGRWSEATVRAASVELAWHSKPLPHAVATGDVEVVRLLLAAGTDAVAAAGNGHRYDSTPPHGAALYVAAEQGDAAMVEALVQGGARLMRDSDHMGMEHEPTSMDEARHPPPRSWGAERGNEAAAAARGGHIAALGALVRAAAADGIEYYRMLHAVALCAAARAGHVAVVEAMLDAGVDVDTYADEHIYHTALHEAARAGQTGVMRALLERGAAAGARECRLESCEIWSEYGRNSGGDAYYHAGGSCYSDAGTANVWQIDNITPLHWAAHSGTVEGVELLLAAGASVDWNSSHGTPLHLAARAGHVPVIESLLAAGAQVDADDGRAGGTPLHHAAYGGCAAAAAALLAVGAAPTARDRFGNMPLDLLLEQYKPDPEMIAVLQRAEEEAAEEGGAASGGSAAAPEEDQAR